MPVPKHYLMRGHSKKCLSRSVICAIENWRDDEHIGDMGFRLNIGSEMQLAYTAISYLTDGLISCICEYKEEN